MFSYVQNDVENCLKGMYLALAYACMNLCQMANPAKQGLKPPSKRDLKKKKRGGGWASMLTRRGGEPD